MSVDAADPQPASIGVREAQRRQTRARLFDAAVAEFGRSGLAGADVAAIAAAAGVARGTFYFHFPTKEHVLAELEKAEEVRIVDMLDATSTGPLDLTTLLTQLVGHVLDAEQRLGSVVFRDMLGLHFSALRPLDAELNEHPLAEFVISAITQAQAAGKLRADADAAGLGVIFLTGLFALLATGATAAQTTILDQFVTTITAGMEA